MEIKLDQHTTERLQFILANCDSFCVTDQMHGPQLVGRIFDTFPVFGRVVISYSFELGTVMCWPESDPEARFLGGESHPFESRDQLIMTVKTRLRELVEANLAPAD